MAYTRMYPRPVERIADTIGGRQDVPFRSSARKHKHNLWFTRCHPGCSLSDGTVHVPRLCSSPRRPKTGSGLPPHVQLLVASQPLLSTRAPEDGQVKCRRMACDTEQRNVTGLYALNNATSL